MTEAKTAVAKPNSTTTQSQATREVYALGRTKKGEAYAATTEAVKAKNAEYRFFSLVGFGRRFAEAGIVARQQRRVERVMRENGIAVASVGLANAIISGEGLDVAIQAAKSATTAEERSIRKLANEGVAVDQKYATLSQENGDNTPLGRDVRDLVRGGVKSTTELANSLRNLASKPDNQSEKAAEIIRNATRGELRQIARDLHELSVQVAKGKVRLDSIDLAITNMVTGDKTLDNLAKTQGLYALAKYMRLGSAATVILAGGLGIALTNPFTAIPAVVALGITFGISWWAKHRGNVAERQIHQRNIARQPNALAPKEERKQSKATKVLHAAGKVVGGIFGNVDVKKYDYARVSADTLLHGPTGVDGLVALGENMKAEDLQAAIDLSVSIDRRLEMSLSTNKQTIDYGRTTRAEFIGEWVAKRSQLRAAIESAGEKLGFTEQTVAQAYQDATTRIDSILLTDQQAKDRAFAVRNVVSATQNAAVTTAISFVFGAAFHHDDIGGWLKGSYHGGGAVDAARGQGIGAKAVTGVNPDKQDPLGVFAQHTAGSKSPSGGPDLGKDWATVGAQKDKLVGDLGQYGLDVSGTEPILGFIPNLDHIPNFPGMIGDDFKFMGDSLQFAHDLGHASGDSIRAAASDLARNAAAALHDIVTGAEKLPGILREHNPNFGFLHHQTPAASSVPTHEAASQYAPSLGEVQHNVNLQYEPDTSGHNWQDYYTSVNGHGLKFDIIPANQVHGADLNNYYVAAIDHTPGHSGQMFFLQNGSTVTPGDMSHNVNIWIPDGHGGGHFELVPSGEVAKWLGIDQQKIDMYAAVVKAAQDSRANGGAWEHVITPDAKDWGAIHWTGTGSTPPYGANDLQQIFHDRFGVGLGGAPVDMRMGGGYFDENGTFHMIASNHYYSGDISSGLYGEHAGLVGGDEAFHTGVGTGLDYWSDRAIHAVDDYFYLWQTNPGAAAGASALFIAWTAGTGYFGGLLGRRLRQSQTWRGRIGRVSMGLATAYAVSFMVNPVAIIPGAVGTAIGFFTGGRGGQQNQGQANANNQGAGGANPPAGGNRLTRLWNRMRGQNPAQQGQQGQQGTPAQPAPPAPPPGTPVRQFVGQGVLSPAGIQQVQNLARSGRTNNRNLQQAAADTGLNPDQTQQLNAVVNAARVAVNNPANHINHNANQPLHIEDVVHDAVQLAERSGVTNPLNLADRRNAEILATALGANDIDRQLVTDAIIRTAMVRGALRNAAPTAQGRADAAVGAFTATADPSGQDGKTNPTIALRQAMAIMREHTAAAPIDSAELRRAFQTNGYDEIPRAVVAAEVALPAQTPVTSASAQQRITEGFHEVGALSGTIDKDKVATVAEGLHAAFQGIDHLGIGDLQRAQNIEAVVANSPAQTNTPLLARIRALSANGITEKVNAAANFARTGNAGGQFTDTQIQAIADELKNGMNLPAPDVDRVFNTLLGVGATGNAVQAFRAAERTQGSAPDRIVAGLRTLPTITSTNADEAALAILQMKNQLRPAPTNTEIQQAVETLGPGIAERVAIASRTFEEQLAALTNPTSRQIEDAAKLAIAASGVPSQTAGQPFTPGSAEVISGIAFSFLGYNLGNPPAIPQPPAGQRIQNIPKLLSDVLRLDPSQIAEVGQIRIATLPPGATREEMIDNLLSTIVDPSSSPEKITQVLELLASHIIPASGGTLPEIDRVLQSVNIGTGSSDEIAKRAAIYTMFGQGTTSTATVQHIFSTQGVASSAENAAAVVQGLLLAHQQEDEIRDAMKNHYTGGTNRDVARTAAAAIRLAGNDPAKRAQMAVLALAPQHDYSQLTPLVAQLRRARPQAVDDGNIRKAIEIMGFDQGEREGIVDASLNDEIRQNRIPQYQAPSGKNQGNRQAVVAALETYIKQAIMFAGYPDLSQQPVLVAGLTARVRAIINTQAATLHIPQDVVDEAVGGVN